MTDWRDMVERIEAWDKWEPPIGKMDPNYQAPEAVSFSECAALIERQAGEIERLRDALEDAQEMIQLMDSEGVRSHSINAPEDGAVKAICEVYGYGAVMDSAARQWFKIDNKGSFVVGPCALTVRLVRIHTSAALTPDTPDA